MSGELQERVSVSEEMAKRMLAEGIPVDVVAKCSGMSTEELAAMM